jgi:hypothetical protein
VAIVVGVGALAVFLWLVSGAKISTTGEMLIDPNDARQMGTLIGLMGGTVADAAVAQFALRRFEEIHGRKATVKEMGIVVGIMKGGR